MNKEEKLTAIIDMETYRKSLIGNGYLKEEVILMSKEELQAKFQYRTEMYIKAMVERVKRLGLW